MERPDSLTMLAVTCDLHLMDGTCNAHAPRVDEAVQLLLEVRDLAREKGMRFFDLVLLGDTIDLLRSERWHEKKLSTAKVDRINDKVDFIASFSRRSSRPSRCWSRRPCARSRISRSCQRVSG